jgi:glucose/arabinose dehydrogenase
MQKNDVIIRRLSIGLVIVAVIILGIYLFRTNIGAVKVPPGDEPTGEAEVTDQNPTKDPLIAKLSIPDGLSMQIFAKNVKGARVIVFDPKGRMLVSETSEGKIVILEDADKDGIAESQRTLVSGLSKPHGMAFDCAETTCTLYVAEHSKLSSYDYGLVTGAVTNSKKLVDIPATATDRHNTRTLQFLPDSNVLLISVGSSCNVCDENDAMRGRIMAYNTATQKVSEYARGLRNAVFMTISPDGKVFATEMGRDGLGDEIPPDEINIIEAGKNYGWPTCYSKNIHDDVYDKRVYIRNPCSEPFETPSFIDLQAHSAPLGLAFVPSDWGSAAGSLLVAYHGSWNRSEPTGYKIARITLDAEGNYQSIEDYISGWLTSDGTKLGRPVALVFGPDNALYISDDDTGNVYRVAKMK